MEEKINKIIDLIFTLRHCENTKQQLSIDFSVSERTMSRYLHCITQVGFNVVKRKGYYSINRDCSYLKSFLDVCLPLDESGEVMKINLPNLQTIEGSEFVEQVKASAENRAYLYSFIKYDELAISKKMNEAIQARLTVILKKYSSPNSATVKDRTVEPLRFTPDHKSIVARDLHDCAVKVFKISRMDDVVFAEEFEVSKQHKCPKIDPFGMAGNKWIDVELKVKMLAKSLLLEEFHILESAFKVDDKNFFIFKTKVINFIGIGRFILGLPDCVDVISPPELLKFVKQKSKKYS